MSNKNEKESMDVDIDIDTNENHEANNNATITQENKSVKSEISSPNHKESESASDDITTNTTTTPPPPESKATVIMDVNKKAALQNKLRRMVAQNRDIVTRGCGNWRCTNELCKSNVENEYRSAAYSDKEASKLAVKMIKMKHKKCGCFPLRTVRPLTQQLVMNDENSSEIVFAFKNWQVLSESFLAPNKKLTDKEICIDFDELSATFSAMVQREELCKDVRLALMESMNLYLNNVIKASQRKVSLCALRQLVIILLLNPLVLSEDISCHDLLRRMVQMITALSSCDFSRIVVMRTWFCGCFSAHVLSKMLSSLQQYMTLRITMCEDEIEDLTDEWRHELSYDEAVANHNNENSNELEEIEQEIARKQCVAREKYIADDIAGVCKLIDIIHYAAVTDSNEDDEKKEESSSTQSQKTSKLNLDLFHNDGLNETICSRSETRSSMHRRDFIHYRERDFFTFLSYPYLLSAASKSKYLEFENLLSQHRARRRRMFDLMLRGGMSGAGAGSSLFRSQLIEELDLVLRIRRSPAHIIGDTLGILQCLSAHDLRKRLRIMFDGEEGIDQGGLTKEYFQLIMCELFDPKYGMFIRLNDDCNYWFNRDSFDYFPGASGRKDCLTNYELVGKLVGIAIYNNTILDLRFPRVLFKKMCSAQNEKVSYTMDDFAQYDEQMAKGFIQLQAMKGSDASKIEEVYCRNFIIEYRNMFGELKQYDLTKSSDGASTMLNGENRDEYIAAYISYILCDSIAPQFDAFLRGFKTVCDSELFFKFCAKELELLICGSDHFDFDALEETTKYQDGLHKNSRLVRDFWNIAHQLTAENKRKLLTFCTGSDRVPINGLGELTLTISKNGHDNAKLPTSHTCFNHLLLPEYSNKEILKLRLLTAIQNSHGFGLL